MEEPLDGGVVEVASNPLPIPSESLIHPVVHMELALLWLLCLMLPAVDNSAIEEVEHAA